MKLCEFGELQNSKYNHCEPKQMVIVAQLVRASDCGSEGRGFETRLSPLTLESPEVIQGFFYSTNFP